MTGSIVGDPTRILRQLEPLLRGASSSIGFALFDRTLRFRFVNDALAAMNRLSVKAHIGAPLRTILADTAEKVEPVFDKVFSTGKAVLQHEFSGTLPSRKEETFWSVSYFPLFETTSKVSQVAAMVLDVTAIRQLHSTFADLLGLFQRAQNGEQSSHLNPVETTKSMYPSGLTNREIEITRLLVNGNSNKQAAAILNVSVRTVESYRAKIMLKLRVHSVPELVRFAIRTKIVES